MMTRSEYIQECWKALREGRVSKEVFDAMLDNAEIFSEEEEEED